MKETVVQSAGNSFATAEAMPPHGYKGALEPSPPISPQEVMGLAIGLLLLALSVAMIMKLRERLRRRKPSSITHEPSAAIGVWEALRTKVDAIRAPDSNLLSEQVRFKAWGDFTSSISLCLRRALELRTGLPLAESTTEEILQILKKSDLRVTAISSAELAVLLHRLDAIRFAGAYGSDEEARDLLTRLKDAIKNLEPGTAVDIVGVSADAGDMKETVRVFE